MITVNYVAVNSSEENYSRVYRPSGSGDFLFICFLSPMHVILEEGILATAPGACIIYRPGDPQDFSAVRDFRISSFHFSIDQEQFDALHLPVNEVFYPRSINQIHETMLRLESEYFTRELFYEESMHAAVMEILIDISREINEDRMNALSERNVYDLFCQARFTMLANCDKAWASTNMCEMVSLSRSQFYKYYDEFFGVSPMQDLTTARIEKAKTLLTNDELSVTEVATRCGYASIHHFSRTFKEHTGLSPLAYVKKKTGADRKDY